MFGVQLGRLIWMIGRLGCEFIFLSYSFALFCAQKPVIFDVGFVVCELVENIVLVFLLLPTLSLSVILIY